MEKWKKVFLTQSFPSFFFYIYKNDNKIKKQRNASKKGA